MFGLNWGELVVIGIVALIAIGPKELPTVLRTLGQYMGKVKRMANEFQGQFQEALREAELTDLQKHAQDLTSSVTDFANIDPLAEVQKTGESAVASIGAAVGDPMPAEPVANEPALMTETPTAVIAAPLPEVSVPLPEALPPVSEKDFAAAPAEPAPEQQPPTQNNPGQESPDQGAPKQAGGSA
jgi:sec-independent protein translocase protein TatB